VIKSPFFEKQFDEFQFEKVIRMIHKTRKYYEFILIKFSSFQFSTINLETFDD